MAVTFNPLTNTYVDAQGRIVPGPVNPQGALNVYAAPPVRPPVTAPVTAAPPLAPNPALSAPEPLPAPAPVGNLPLAAPASAPQGSSYYDNGSHAALAEASLGSDPGALSPTSTAPEPGALTAPQDSGGLFSFLDKPGASDSLVAFGSAMLRGNTFNEGLANAADAVNQVAQQYRPLTPREVELMKQKAMLRNYGSGGSSYAASQVGYAPGLGYIPSRFNKDTGLTEYQLPDGTVTTKMPDGFEQRVDSAVGDRNTAAAKFETEARDNATKAFTDIQTYDQMLSLLPQAGAGPDVLSQAKRQFVTLTGVNLDGVNLSDMQTVNKLARDLELSLAQTQRGLGQFTEMERRIVQEALPSLSTDGKAFRDMLQMLRTRAEKAQRLYEDWLSMPPDVKTSQYNGSFETFAYFWRKQNSGSSAPASGGGAASGGSRPSLDSIFN